MAKRLRAVRYKFGSDVDRVAFLDSHEVTGSGGANFVPARAGIPKGLQLGDAVIQIPQPRVVSGCRVDVEKPLPGTSIVDDDGAALRVEVERAGARCVRL